MINEQFMILAILLATMAMFLWGHWRHDMVAAGALLSCVLTGLIPANEAFSGFSHPAVITVACVLVLSRGLQTSGAVDVLTRTVLPAKAGVTLSLTALIALGAGLSSFMNNVGAMALLMPVAIQIAKRLDMPPGQVLMPLSFGTILGGMTTLISTPPNLIVSGFRAETGTGGFAMFDFTLVGLAVAVGGVAFIALLGRRLVPERHPAGIEGFVSGAYITEARVPEGSKAVGKLLRELEPLLEETDAHIIGMVYNDVRITAPNPWRRIQTGNILVIEAEAEALARVLSALDLELEEAVNPSEKFETQVKIEQGGNATVGKVNDRGKDLNKKGAQKDKNEEKGSASGEIVLMELAVLPTSTLAGRSASSILLRTRYGLNLLALSRQGQQLMKRLRSVKIKSGDLLLMQGPPEVIMEFAADNSCVPLAERELRIPNKRKVWTAGIIMALAVGGAGLGLLPAAISFAMGVLASMALRTVSPRAVYGAIDWPVIVLLAALIPVAGVMETTGAADLIARFLLENAAQGQAVVGLAIVLIVTMFLSDLMNNAATAAVMCPIAISTATALGVSADSFLMAVAIGASCAFLTPIGHQNNTLILGPGGFRFGDYWKLGLMVEILVVAISIPLLLLAWPL
jgi:di/tricarboxylate transporter